MVKDELLPGRGEGEKREPRNGKYVGRHVHVPILQQGTILRVGERPPNKVEFREWVQRQVAFRGGDPRREMNDVDQPAWDYFLRFEESVLYEDDDLLVVNKPPGVVTHYKPDPVGVEEIARARRHEGVESAHQIDRNTTGVLILTKNTTANLQMQEQFRKSERAQIKKMYLALLDGVFLPTYPVQLNVDLYVPNDGKMEILPKGTDRNDPRYNLARTSTMIMQRDAVVRDGDGDLRTLADVQIITRMTNQIRIVAAEHLGMPVTGDTFYGSQTTNAPRCMLHAREITIAHPKRKKQMTFTAPIPQDFTDYLSTMSVEYYRE